MYAFRLKSNLKPRDKAVAWVDLEDECGPSQSSFSTWHSKKSGASALKGVIALRILGDILYCLHRSVKSPSDTWRGLSLFPKPYEMRSSIASQPG